MNKALREPLRELLRRGYTVKNGKKHEKLYDPAGNFVMALPHGNHRHDKVPGGTDRTLRKLLDGA